MKRENIEENTEKKEFPHLPPPKEAAALQHVMHAFSSIGLDLSYLLYRFALFIQGISQIMATPYF